MDGNNQNQNQQQQPVQGYFVVQQTPYGYAVPQQQTPMTSPYPDQVPQATAYYFASQTPQNGQQPTPTPGPSAQYYMPQPTQAYYYDPSSVSAPHPQAEQGIPMLIPSGLHARDRLKLKEYDVKSSLWMEDAWELFKKNWLPLVLFTLIFIGVQWIPYVGPIISNILGFGFYLAGAHAIRTGEFKTAHLFHGLYLFFPLFLITCLVYLIVGVGLIFCIVPGLYFMVAYSFAVPIYIEYRQEGVGIIDSLNISRHVISKNFWSITGFMILQFCLIIVGALAFGVGLLVAVPVVYFMLAFAFRDIFGFSEQRVPENTVVCC